MGRGGVIVAFVLLAAASCAGLGGLSSSDDDAGLPARADAGAETAPTDDAAGCAPGVGFCPNNGPSACNTTIATDIENCGSCGHRCGNAYTTSVNCQDGACALSCVAGHASCDGDDTNGCETNVAGTDATNCGACGHSCQGAACVNGKCQPIPLLTTGLAGPPGNLAFDGVTLFFSVGGTIYRCAKTGCMSGATTVLTPTGGVVALTADEALPDGGEPGSGRLYWRSSSGVPVHGSYASVGTEVDFGASGDPSSTIVASDPSFVYWTKGAAIERQNKYGSGIPALYASTGANLFATDGKLAVWSPPAGGIVTCKASMPCAAADPLVATGTIDALALDATEVAFVVSSGTTGILETCPRSGCGAGGATTLVSGIAKAYATYLVSDGTTLYFVDGTTAIRSCAAAGCAGVATDVVTGQTAIAGLAVDETFVYWLSGSSVFKQAK